MLKKLLINSFLCATLLMQASCVTKYLWGDKHYEEKIEQFFVGADGRYVVLVGSNYHYIFTDSSGVLKDVLMLKQRGILTFSVEKSYLKLNSNNDLNGYIVLEGPFDLLPMEDIGLLQSRGFRPNKENEISIKINLSGRRYQAKYLGQGATGMSTSYMIPVYYSDSGLVKGVGKAAITPVAVTLDAVLLIGKVVVYPLSW